jgi:hypothetical protein
LVFGYLCILDSLKRRSGTGHVFAEHGDVAIFPGYGRCSSWLIPPDRMPQNADEADGADAKAF